MEHIFAPYVKGRGFFSRFVYNASLSLLQALPEKRELLGKGLMQTAQMILGHGGRSAYGDHISAREQAATILKALPGMAKAAVKTTGQSLKQAYADRREVRNTKNQKNQLHQPPKPKPLQEQKEISRTETPGIVLPQEARAAPGKALTGKELIERKLTEIRDGQAHDLSEPKRTKPLRESDIILEQKVEEARRQLSGHDLPEPPNRPAPGRNDRGLDR